MPAKKKSSGGKKAPPSPIPIGSSAAERHAQTLREEAAELRGEARELAKRAEESSRRAGLFKEAALNAREAAREAEAKARRAPVKGGARTKAEARAAKLSGEAKRREGVYRKAEERAATLRVDAGAARELAEDAEREAGRAEIHASWALPRAAGLLGELAAQWDISLIDQRDTWVDQPVAATSMADCEPHCLLYELAQLQESREFQDLFTPPSRDYTVGALLKGWMIEEGEDPDHAAGSWRLLCPMADSAADFVASTNDAAGLLLEQGSPEVLIALRVYVDLKKAAKKKKGKK